MVSYLLRRPIAVSMAFLALLLLGWVATLEIPVSLLPNVDIPKVSVLVSNPSMSARQLEQSVTKPLRQQLLQVGQLKDIHSETRDGLATLKLDFEYGANIDYAFIEINERVNRTSASFPKETEAPKIVKASANDIPIFYLDVVAQQEKKSTQETQSEYQNMLGVSSFVDQVIKKRIEQLPEIAMVDISGLSFPQVYILPKLEKMTALQLSPSIFEKLIQSHSIDLGNLSIRDGQYQYSIRFNNVVRTPAQLARLEFLHHGKLLKLQDIAQVLVGEKEVTGRVLSQGQAAISMAIIKQASAKLEHTQESLKALLAELEVDYPQLRFRISRDQSKLLRYSMSNLKQSLGFGLVLALLVMFFFLQDFRSPLLIGISIPVSLMLTLLAFFLSGVSINVISLSGLILGLGMMFDNSIIVIDNISQHIARGKPLAKACADGTHEVIAPLVSSLLTTCSVFLPLVFMGGISGALFFDQAISVSFGLLSSLLVSITLLPVYFYLLRFRKEKKTSKAAVWLSKINKLGYEEAYEKGFALVMRNHGKSAIAILVLLAGTYFLASQVPLDRLPATPKKEILLQVEWNERISLAENTKRCEKLTAVLNEQPTYHSAYIGRQQFLQQELGKQTGTSVLFYFEKSSQEGLDSLQQELSSYLQNSYSAATFSFQETDNIFNAVFADRQHDFVVKLHNESLDAQHYQQALDSSILLLRKTFPQKEIATPSYKQVLLLEANLERLTLYKVNLEQLINSLQTALNAHQLHHLTLNNYNTAVVLGQGKSELHNLLQHTVVQNEQGENLPAQFFIKLQSYTDVQRIVADKSGAYFPVQFPIHSANIAAVEQQVQETLASQDAFSVSFAGSLYSNPILLRRMLLILLLSLGLLYFILAAQFESFSLPLIILVEIPLDLFGAFLFLYLADASLNLMSMIGIVVMAGIVINDSILKIDTIKNLEAEGYSLLHALLVGGQRRLKPILMTSLTTILAMVPVFFASGMGVALQKPLALALVGGLGLGTFISLYFIPLAYYYLRRNKT